MGNVKRETLPTGVRSVLLSPSREVVCGTRYSAAAQITVPQRVEQPGVRSLAKLPRQSKEASKMDTCVSTQESSTPYKVQGQAAKRVALIPSGLNAPDSDSVSSRLPNVGFSEQYCKITRCGVGAHETVLVDGTPKIRSAAEAVGRAVAATTSFGHRHDFLSGH